MNWIFEAYSNVYQATVNKASRRDIEYHTILDRLRPADRAIWWNAARR